MKIIIKNILLFLVGYCAYIAIEVTFRGVSYPLMGICAGLAVIIIDKINDYISWDIDIILQGEISLRTELLPIMWNYSNVSLNFDGIVCVLFSLIWVGLSIIGILVADAINYYMLNIQPCLYYKCLGKVIFRFKERT